MIATDFSIIKVCVKLLALLPEVVKTVVLNLDLDLDLILDFFIWVKKYCLSDLAFSRFSF